jgi:hypothetical protein
MKHNRKPVPEALLEQLGAEDQTQDDLPPEEKGFLICDLCGESGEGTITLQNETGFVICAECVDSLSGIVTKIRADMGIGGDLCEHRRLN